MSTRHDERLDRLAGDGVSGGGLALPDAFRPVLNELLDNGPADTGRLAELISESLSYKSDQILHTWKSWNRFTRDVLAQLNDRKIIEKINSVWQLGAKFETDKRLVVVPRRKGKNESVGVTIYTADERKRLADEEERRRTVTEYLAKLRSRGLRSIDPRRVERIKSLINEFGDYSDVFPVIVDKDGTVLDGRHRREVNPDWPSVTVSRDDDELLAIALLANEAREWTKDQLQELEAACAAVSHPESKRERIKTALLKWPDLSHNKIANKLHVDHKTVDKACREVGIGPNFSCTHGKSGQGARADLPRSRPDPELTPAQEIRANELLDQGAGRRRIAEDLDIPESRARAFSEKTRQERKDKIKKDPEHQHRWVCSDCGAEAT